MFVRTHVYTSDKFISVIYLQLNNVHVVTRHNGHAVISSVNWYGYACMLVCVCVGDCNNNNSIIQLFDS